ncbi:hypothetical protein VUR80DRAFT_9832 [Thermomyces stellatus]
MPATLGPGNRGMVVTLLVLPGWARRLRCLSECEGWPGWGSAPHHSIPLSSRTEYNDTSDQTLPMLCLHSPCSRAAFRVPWLSFWVGGWDDTAGSWLAEGFQHRRCVDTPQQGPPTPFSCSTVSASGENRCGDREERVSWWLFFFGGGSVGNK